MNFKLRITWGGVDYDYPVLHNVEQMGLSQIKLHGMPEPCNRVILRSGLRYDEAWLCLPPMDSPPSGFDANFLPRRLNESYPMSIVIDGWETNNWRPLHTWKISCGHRSIWLVHFVDTRYVLCEHPAPAPLSIAASSLGTTTIRGTARHPGTTVEFQKSFGTGSLEEAMEKVLLGGGVLFGGSTDYHEMKIGNHGTWVSPWSDSTWSTLVGHFSDISLVDKSTLHFAQYLLDHYYGVLVRNYTSPDADKQESDYDIIDWDSGSAITGPYLCSWDSPRPTSGSTLLYGPSLLASRYIRRNWTNGAGSYQTQVAGTGSASLPFPNGRVRSNYEYSDIDDSGWTSGPFAGSFSTTPLNLSMARHLNRNSEGYTVAGYVSGAPTGKFDTVIFEKGTTTYIRGPIPRPVYHPQPIGQVYWALADDAIAAGASGPITVLHENMAGTRGEESVVHNASGTAIASNDELPVFKRIQTMGYQRLGTGTRYLFFGNP